MAGTFLKDENAANGLPSGTTTPRQAGVSDGDDGGVPELKLALPFVGNPQATYLHWECVPEIRLSSGLALHRPLPQRQYAADSLSRADVYGNNPSGDSGESVNVSSRGQWTDYLQRCANSEYRFRLYGRAWRVALPVAIPGLVRFSNLVFTPDRQKVTGPSLVGNLSGFPVFYADWDLWYVITTQPRVANFQAPPNLAARVRGDQQLPSGVPVPYSPADDNSVPGPSGPSGFFTA